MDVQFVQPGMMVWRTAGRGIEALFIDVVSGQRVHYYVDEKRQYTGYYPSRRMGYLQYFAAHAYLTKAEAYRALIKKLKYEIRRAEGESRADRRTIEWVQNVLDTMNSQLTKEA